MLLTENTTNDTCQSNLRGAWNDVSTGTQKLRLLSASSLSVYLICDTASSESGTRNLLGACRHKVVVSAFLGIRRFPTLLEDFPNTIFSKFFSSSKILLLESPLNFHAS